MAIQITLDFERPLAELRKKIAELQQLSQSEGMDFSRELAQLEDKAHGLETEIFRNLTPWQRVQLARHPQHPYTLDYIHRIFTSFQLLRGDRAFGEDAALVGGLAEFRGRPAMVMGHQKGRNTKENIERNFGMCRPEGYRKAVRLMRMAEHFRLPIIMFIDTPGAYPGMGAEERGQAQAIAEALETASALTVPTIAVIIGEGGSGGALAVGIANQVLMLRYAIYSVISPEACSSILFKDARNAEIAAGNLRLTSHDIFELGVADALVDEAPGAAHRDPDKTAELAAAAIAEALERLDTMNGAELRRHRLAKFRALGQFLDPTAAPSRRGRGEKAPAAGAS